MKSEYEIVIGLYGTVTTTLTTQGQTQGSACAVVQQLTNSLGRVTTHDKLDAPDQPVNIFLNIPGL